MDSKKAKRNAPVFNQITGVIPRIQGVCFPICNKSINIQLAHEKLYPCAFLNASTNSIVLSTVMFS
jgi:hypothetical protein